MWLPQTTRGLLNIPLLGAQAAGLDNIVGLGAALANAVYDATGVRLRTAPFTPERVRATLNSNAS